MKRLETAFLKIAIWKRRKVLIQIAGNVMLFWKHSILKGLYAILKVKLWFCQTLNCVFKNYFLKSHILKSHFFKSQTQTNPK
jgi:hypothetical protein